MFMRSLIALVGAQLIELRRSRTAIFWMMAFPLGFLLLFGFVMARGDARAMAVLMPGLLTTTLMSGSLFGVALPLAGVALPADVSRATHLGVRPEHLLQADAGTAAFAPLVEVVEPVGNEVFVNLRHDGRTLVARLPPGTLPVPGETLPLQLSPTGLHFFDADGLRIA